MPKSAAVSAPTKTIPTFDEFREAVKYILLNDHGMPDLVAEEILSADVEFLETNHGLFSKLDNAVAKTANSFAFEPATGITWVQLQTGMRTANKDQVVIDVGGEMGCYLEHLVQLGLHGASRDAVARIMLARGIESVFPLIVGKRTVDGRT